MTKATAVRALLGQVKEIPLAELEASSFNPRRTFNEASLKELAASIREIGITTPLIVREVHVDGDPELGTPHYEIIAGHRRSEAATIAGLKTVPCIVRELDDAAARELAVIENLQREDVPPLEEADAYLDLMQRLGTHAAIAARVGKEVAYIARRLQLVSLAEMPRKALAERLITIDHALLLARLGPDEQNVNLKWALDVNAGTKTPVEKVIETRIADLKGRTRWKFEPQSPLRLKEHIEQYVGRKLARAPWDLNDAELIRDAGPCSSCPSNTAANDTLFGDLNIEKATCENGVCYEAKRAAFVQIRFASAGDTQLERARTADSTGRGDGVALKVSWKSSVVKPRVHKEGGIRVDQVFRYGQWIDAKAKSCEFVRLGVTVDWNDYGKERKPGEILNVCISEKCKVHKKGYAGAEKRDTGLQNENSPEARAEREKRKAEADAENQFRGELLNKAIAGVTKLPAEVLRKIVLESADAAWDYSSRFPGGEKILKTAKVDSPEFARAAVGVLFVFASDESEIWASGHLPVTDGRKEFIAELKLLGYDASKAWDNSAKLPPPLVVEKAAPKKAAPKKKSILSGADRKRIADAQKKRWAAKKGGKR